MFGYVRPLTPELRVRELEMFKALYCGICHALGRKYGLAARFILSYDFVFLCSLLWQPDERPVYKMRRCPAGFRKKRVVSNINPATERAAGFGVILAWHKLSDNIRDDGFVKAAASRGAMAALADAYRKARREFPDFDDCAKRRLGELSQLEGDRSARPDALANAFAGLLSDIASGEDDEARRRVFSELLYHLGRWLYYIDARDDLSRDLKTGAPNPLKSGEIDDAALELTLNHSVNLAAAAFELLPETAWSDINRNVLYYGLAETQERVRKGESGSSRGYRNI